MTITKEELDFIKSTVGILQKTANKAVEFIINNKLYDDFEKYLRETDPEFLETMIKYAKGE